MGRGGCEVVDFGMNTVRSIMGCFCCMVCAGPLLLIIGVIMLVAPNNYAKMVSDYNAAATNFVGSGDKAAMQGSSGTMNGISLTVASSTKPLSSASSLPTGDNVQAGIVSISLSTPTSTTLPASGTLTDNDGRSAVISTYSVASASGTQTINNLRCPSGGSSSSSSSYCYQSDMQSICASAAGCSSSSVSWSFSGSSVRCSGGSTCYGTCSYTVKQIAQCSQLKHSNVTGFSISANSCLYPFGNSNQPTQCSSSSSSSNSTSSSSSMSIIFLSENDPFIAAQRITTGSMSFGLTEAQQRSIGLVLMVIGIIIIAGLVGMCILIKKTFFKNDESRRRMYGAFGRSYNGMPVYQYGQPQQPYYAQQDAYVASGGMMMMPQQPQQMVGMYPPPMQNNGFAPAPNCGINNNNNMYPQAQTYNNPNAAYQQQPYF